MNAIDWIKPEASFGLLLLFYHHSGQEQPTATRGKQKGSLNIQYFDLIHERPMEYLQE